LRILLVLHSVQLESYTMLGAVLMDAEMFELHTVEDNHVSVYYSYDFQDLGWHIQYSECATGSMSRARVFWLSKAARQPLGPTQPSIQWVLGTFSTGINLSGHTADH
jgi:hypothetical protein